MKTIRQILAITMIDLRATFRRGETVFFGLLFPMIFIFVFGSLGQGSATYNIAVQDGSDTNNPLYQAISEVKSFELDDTLSNEEITKKLERGELEGSLYIENTTVNQIPSYNITLSTSAVDIEEGAIIKSVVTGIIDKLNLAISGVESPPLSLNYKEIQGREFKQIDFILPGQLSFALLSSGVFGTSFLIVSLKETLVLKRFFATPMRKRSIVLGLALSKLVFGLLQATVLILAGKFIFGFTLVNGLSTFFEIMVLSTFALFVFLGFGLVISSIAKDQNSVSPIANIVTLPQFLLAGTFFPITLFPDWLQPISKILPLTYLNEALRSVAFDGESIFSQTNAIIALIIWGILVYGLTVKYFSWDN
ncbi:ABC transporter permease [Candidatus Nomurabacteria bacterium]|nr:ABC transporter permease [Candidatus Nomurabacteria bacterium]